MIPIEFPSSSGILLKDGEKYFHMGTSYDNAMLDGEHIIHESLVFEFEKSAEGYLYALQVHLSHWLSKSESGDVSTTSKAICEMVESSSVLSNAISSLEMIDHGILHDFEVIETYDDADCKNAKLEDSMLVLPMKDGWYGTSDSKMIFDRNEFKNEVGGLEEQGADDGYLLEVSLSGTVLYFMKEESFRTMEKWSKDTLQRINLIYQKNDLKQIAFR